jgi:ATP-dependent Clp protease protease subunit
MVKSMSKCNENDEDTDVKDASLTPKIVEDSLFKNRHILITGEINDRVAKVVTEKLLALSGENEEPINIFISSPGGHVESGDMIHDVIKFITPEVRIIGSGWVASAAALIFVAAKKANRFCFPHTRFMLHQPRGGMGGSAADIAIQTEQIMSMKERFERIFAEATGQTVDRIREDTKRDFWLNTEEAINYGLLDTVVNTQAEWEALTRQ